MGTTFFRRFFGRVRAGVLDPGDLFLDSGLKLGRETLHLYLDLASRGAPVPTVEHRIKIAGPASEGFADLQPMDPLGKGPKREEAEGSFDCGPGTESKIDCRAKNCRDKNKLDVSLQAEL